MIAKLHVAFRILDLSVLNLMQLGSISCPKTLRNAERNDCAHPTLNQIASAADPHGLVRFNIGEISARGYCTIILKFTG